MSVYVSSLIWKIDAHMGKKIVLLKMADCANDFGGDIFPSQKRIAKDCGCTDRHVRDVIQWALNEGILIENSGPGNRVKTYCFDLELLVNNKTKAEEVSGRNTVPVKRNTVPTRWNTVPTINNNHQLTVNKPSMAKKRFSPPSDDDCRGYAEEIGLPVAEAERFRNYHQSRGWVVGKSSMKDWKAAMRTWKGNWVERNPGKSEKRGWKADIQE